MSRPMRFLGSLTAAAMLFAAGCGGGGGGDSLPAPGAQVMASAGEVAAATDDAAVPATAAPVARILAAGVTRFNDGVPDPGLLMLLVPDGLSPSSPGVTGWIDAASEVGTRLAPITDSQFMALGEAGARAYAGLVLPDQLHPLATDALLAAIRRYVTAGGQAMLNFDFGALTLNLAGQPVFPVPKSRLSDLAGVDYVLYDALGDRTVGLGPVTAMRSTMRELLVPPGKSMPYASAPLLATLEAALAPDESLFLPVSPNDAGGVQGFDSQQFHDQPPEGKKNKGSKGKKRKPLDLGKAAKGKKPAGASQVQPRSSTPIPVEEQSEAGAQTSALAATATVDSLDVVTGYLLGPLIYPSYVTSGPFAGVPLAQSPAFGLVAGINPVGAGQVLFVNLPLTYLKGRTDALPMHGFLNYFVQHMLGGARLSTMPNAVAGMTLDWHLDSMEAQAPTLALEQAGVFKAGSFSIEMTAGPDAVVPGDGLGWNLNNNSVARQFLRRMDDQGHAVGSHGGWIHDYFGDNADETNASTFLDFLKLNRSAVDGAIGHKSRGYSAPQGNNPTWAMQWLEQQGVVAAYFGGHTGLGITRHYRDGVLRTPKLWVVPVTPLGLYATFEEFQDFNVSQQEAIAWYRELVDFTVTQNTHRMVYAHPPGADAWRSVLQDFLAHAAAKGRSRFMWYSMPRMADFMAARNRVQWSQTVLRNGSVRFNARHPDSLREMVWMLPKSRYLKPSLDSSKMGTVSDGGNYWLVKARSVEQLVFRAGVNGG